jgi:hypothetical protein
MENTEIMAHQKLRGELKEILRGEVRSYRKERRQTVLLAFLVGVMAVLGLEFMMPGQPARALPPDPAARSRDANKRPPQDAPFSTREESPSLPQGHPKQAGLTL